MLDQNTIISDWKTKAQLKQNSSVDYIYYAVLRGYLSGKSPEKVAEYLVRAFSPVKNATKLANGRYPYDTLRNNFHALSYYRYGLDALLTEQQKRELVLYRENIRRNLP